MKTLFKYLIICLIPSLLFAQKEEPNKVINGTYYLLEAERGVDTKLFEFGEHNGTKLLAIAACKKCMPAVYTYQEEDSKELGIPVFFNSTGLYMFQYDSESFVMIMPNVSGKGDWTNFSFANFYSKSKTKVDNMTKKKLKNYIISISE